MNCEIVNGTNFVPRMSTGVELQVIMPIVNAPFRIYYAWNPLRMNTFTQTPVTFTKDMFPNMGLSGYGKTTYTRHYRHTVRRIRSSNRRRRCASR